MPEGRLAVTLARWALVALGALLMLIGLVRMGSSQPSLPPRAPAPVPMGAVPPAPERAGEAGDPLAPVWERFLPDIVALALSPDGGHALAVDARGLLRCFDAAGRELWTRDVGDADTLALSRGGRLALACALRQPFRRAAFLLDERGALLARVELSAPIQAAAVSPDGRLAAIAAGRSLRLCRRTPAGIQVRAAEAPGEVTRLCFAADGALYAALRDPSGVALLRSDGALLWRRNTPGEEAPSLSVSDDGRLVAVGAQRPKESLEVMLLDRRNRVVWSEVRPGRAPRVRIAAAGSAVLLTYEHRVEHQNERRYERRLAYLGGRGGPSWTKGGAYTAPLFLAAGRGGEWVVALEARLGGEGLPRFRLFDRTGARLWIYTAPAHVLIAAASQEGGHIAAYRTDGVLELLRVTAR